MGKDGVLRIVIPSDYKKKMMRSFHDSICGGAFFWMEYVQKHIQCMILLGRPFQGLPLLWDDMRAITKGKFQTKEANFQTNAIALVDGHD